MMKLFVLVVGFVKFVGTMLLVLFILLLVWFEQNRIFGVLDLFVNSGET